MRKFSLLFVVWLLLGVSAFAQTPEFEVYGGYSHMIADVSNTSFNLDGGEANAVQNVNHWFGGMLDFGTQWGTRNGYNVNSQQVLYGPVFSYRRSKLVPSAYVLLGVVRGSQGFDGISESSTRFGAALGGKIDYKISRMVSFRVLQADDLITNFLGTHQSNIRLSAGLVFTFGNKNK
ncbi:MAG TPA: hypothetical protein VFC10_12850 [Terriglobia bacterium]|nr:hypothetical protein [Terriglobia bacterium]